MGRSCWGEGEVLEITDGSSEHIEGCKGKDEKAFPLEERLSAQSCADTTAKQNRFAETFEIRAFKASEQEQG